MFRLCIKGRVGLLIHLFVVFGAVIGKQSGRSIEMLNSFELVTNEVEGSIVVDTAYYEMKSEQCKLPLYVYTVHGVYRFFAAK